MFIEVREPGTGKLLFRFDPERDLIQIARRGVVTVVDLSQYRPAERRNDLPAAPATAGAVAGKH